MSGTCESVTKKGDRLVLDFQVWAVGGDANGIVFDGVFQVVGGEGKFAFERPTAEGDWGHGTLSGSARVTPLGPGQFVMAFEDRFDGVIAVPEPSGPKR